MALYSIQMLTQSLYYSTRLHLINLTICRASFALQMFKCEHMTAKSPWGLWWALILHSELFFEVNESSMNFVKLQKAVFSKAVMDFCSQGKHSLLQAWNAQSKISEKLWGDKKADNLWEFNSTRKKNAYQNSLESVVHFWIKDRKNVHVN